MAVEVTSEYKAVRRAYELGRLRSALLRAVVVAVPVAAFGIATSGRSVLVMLPFTFGVWVLAHWRGDAFLRGSFYGLLGGLITSSLPMSILRPCCAAGAPPGMDCCTMPGACLGAGAVVGILLAAVVPFGSAAWWRTASGVALGMASVAVLKCTTLIAGEAFGLVGGLMAGVAAATAARVVARRRLTT